MPVQLFCTGSCCHPPTSPISAPTRHSFVPGWLVGWMAAAKRTITLLEVVALATKPVWSLPKKPYISLSHPHILYFIGGQPPNSREKRNRVNWTSLVDCNCSSLAATNSAVLELLVGWLTADVHWIRNVLTCIAIRNVSLDDAASVAE